VILNLKVLSGPVTSAIRKERRVYIKLIPRTPPIVILRISMALTISTAMSKQGDHVLVFFNRREKQLLKP